MARPAAPARLVPPITTSWVLNTLTLTHWVERRPGR